MTQEHPITPPPEMVEQWVTETWHEGTTVLVAASDAHIATQAARWGADTELEACVAWLEYEDEKEKLRAARPPKPLSLKEQALMALEDGDIGPGASLTPVEVCIIRRALESVPD